MMRFCQICNNMLYPRENKKMKRLEYTCKQNECGYVEKVINDSCVYINELVKDSSTKLEVIQSDLNKDPTLQRMRNINCSECGHDEAVFFLAEQTQKSKALNLVFICCGCGKKWLE